MSRRSFAVVAMFALAALFAGRAFVAAAADRKGAKPIDSFWASPALTSLPVSSIALLPVATFDGSFEARRNVEAAIAQALKGSGHRWVSPALTAVYLRAAGGDSALQALNAQLLRAPRLDSLQAPAMSRLAHARALLTVRVDQYEQNKLEFDQSGRPSTSIQLKAALVDSTGQLLWRASGGETMEGPFQDATANPISVTTSGLSTQPVTSQGGPPDYREVLSKMLARWTDAFPHRSVADSTAAH